MEQPSGASLAVAEDDYPRRHEEESTSAFGVADRLTAGMQRTFIHNQEMELRPHVDHYLYLLLFLRPEARLALSALFPLTKCATG